MTSEPDTLTLDERRARDAVRALPRPEPDPALRARLRADFLDGTLRSPFERATPRTRPAAGPLAWLRPLAWAAAAAALLIVVVMANRGPVWQLETVRGDGIAVVDQQPIPLTHREQLARALRGGSTVVVPPGATLELAAAGNLMLQVTAGTEARLPAVPGRWFGREVNALVRHGEVLFTTGPSFHGARLAVATPEAHVMVTGTTLAVICEATGTCVCVLDGRVQVGTGPADMRPVEAGHRRYVFKDGRTPEMADMRDTEHLPLTDLRARFARP